MKHKQFKSSHLNNKWKLSLNEMFMYKINMRIRIKIYQKILSKNNKCQMNRKRLYQFKYKMNLNDIQL